MNDLQKSLFDAMSAFSTNNSNSESTLIIECLIKNRGDVEKQYIVSYQGSDLVVYSRDDEKYSQGDEVYVLVPNGDFSNTLYIFGTINPLLSTSLDRDENLPDYIRMSGDILSLVGDKEEQEKCKNHELLNNGTEIFQYIINSSNPAYKNLVYWLNEGYTSIEFNTNIDADLDSQRLSLNSNYGVKIEIPILNDLGYTIYRTYSIDTKEDTIYGDQYNLKNSFQSQIFKVDIGDPSCKIDTENDIIITYYKENFNETKESNIDFTNTSLYVVDSIKDGLYVDITEGNIFTKDNNSEKSISAKLILDRTKIDLTNAIIKWYVEDNTINSNNMRYDSSIGAGWRYLNDIKFYDETDINEYEFITNVNLLKVQKNDIYSKATYKCVVILNDKTYSTTFQLVNDIKPPMVYVHLEKIGGQDTEPIVGEVRLLVTTYLNPLFMKEKGIQEELIPSCLTSYFTRWGQNNEKITETSKWNIYRSNVKVEKYIPDVCEDIKDKVLCYETEVGFPSSKIDIVNDVQCTVKYGFLKVNENDLLFPQDQEYTAGAYSSKFQKTVPPINGTDILIGTTNKVTIKVNKNISYFVKIINDNKLYMYDTKGISPAQPSYNGPAANRIQTIQPLNFIFRKPSGEELTEQEYANITYTWKVPKNSLFIIPDLETDPRYKEEDSTDEYYILSGSGKANSALVYRISNNYNLKKADKKIYLSLTFGEKHFEDDADILFSKEGNLGSNGTSLFGRICVKGFSTELEPYSDDYKFRLMKCSDGIAYYDYKGKCWKPYLVLNSGKYAAPADRDDIYFIAEAYKDGELIYNGYTVQYSIVDRDYLGTFFNTKIANGHCYLEYYDNVQNKNDYRTIIQAEIKFLDAADRFNTVYCYYPIEVYISNKTLAAARNEGITFLDTKGGYIEVMYNPDGSSADYNNQNDFEFYSSFDRTFTCTIDGNAPDGKTPSGIISGDTFTIREEEVKNDKAILKITPPTKRKSPNSVYALHYSCEDVFDYYVPIMLYYNRYSMENLNGWDGNKTKVENDYILSPQIGAGEKNSDNTFSGIIIGRTQNNLGLLGYNHGIQSIFLNANDGSAIFGAAGKGQIQIIPSSNKAIIKSGNYISNKSGMQIDLSTPSIEFGTGNFKVDAEGILYAKGVNVSGNVNITGGGLTVSKDNKILFKADVTNRTVNIGGFPLNNIAIYNGTNSISSTTKGLYLGTNGIRNYESDTQYVQISGGKITAQGADIKGKITATSGTIGGCSIDANGHLIIPSGHVDGTFSANKINGGTITGVAYNNGNGTFFVDANGNLTAKNATITGTLTAGSVISNTYFNSDKNGVITATSGNLGGMVEDILLLKKVEMLQLV